MPTYEGGTKGNCPLLSQHTLGQSCHSPSPSPPHPISLSGKLQCVCEEGGGVVMPRRSATAGPEVCMCTSMLLRQALQGVSLSGGIQSYRG